MTDARERVLAGLRGSPKYRDIAPAALKRTATWAVERHSKPNDALKAAKRKLHQVFGAYLDPKSLKTLDRHMDNLDAGADLDETCRTILRLHRSSEERLDVLEAFYQAIWDEVGEPSAVLDVAAGFNAFALPFAGLPTDTRYTALEIDRRLANTTSRFLAIIGRSGTSLWCDVLSDFETDTADVAFVLKTLPCLEQQEDGAAKALLERLTAVHTLVVTYPVRSLGGREKGMREKYLADVERLARDSCRTLTIIPFDDELIAILKYAET